MILSSCTALPGRTVTAVRVPSVLGGASTLINPLGHVVEPQVEIASKVRKQLIRFQILALKPGACNRVARGKITTECHTRALSQRPKAMYVLFRACKHGVQPAQPHHTWKQFFQSVASASAAAAPEAMDSWIVLGTS